MMLCQLGSESKVTVVNMFGDTLVVTFIDCGTYRKASRVNYTGGASVRVGSEEWEEAVALAFREV